jgi:hypothetical protein
MSTTGAVLLSGWRRVKRSFVRDCGGGSTGGCTSTGRLHRGTIATEGARGYSCAARSAHVGPASGFLDG